VKIVILLEFPAFPVFAMDEFVGVLRIRDTHFFRVPLDLFAGAIGDVAKVVRFGEQPGVFEIGTATLAAFATGDPFIVMTG